VRTHFHDDRFGYLSNITVITATIFEAVNLVILIKRFMEYVVELNSCGMKVRIAILAILRFRLRNLRDCNVGIIDGRDLWLTLLRCLYVVRYSYQVS
jgi:hypothetical protein